MSEAQDELENMAFTPLGAPAAGSGDGFNQDDQDNAEQQRVLDEGMKKLLLGVLKIARAQIAKKLPEILEEWPDPVIDQPAAAAVPLAKRYMGSIMERLGQNPELAMFCMSLVPLVMGFMAAQEKNARTVENTATEQNYDGPRAV